MTSPFISSPLRRAFPKALVAIALMLCLPALQPLAAAQAAPPAKPAPDVIIFTNGDQLTGTLERGVGDSVVFKSDMAGEITVPLAKIKELRSATNFAVIKKGPLPPKAPAETGTIVAGEGNLTVSSSNAAPQTIPGKDVAYIIDLPTYNKELKGHDGFRQGWNGSITGGATVVRSTQNGTTFTAGVSAIRTVPTVAYLPKRERTIFNLVESYGKLTQPVIPPTTPPTPDSVAKTNIFHSDIEEDKYFNQRFYALITAAFDHNYSQGLNLQQVYGGGFGWTAVQTPKQQLDLTVNIHYEKQTFQAAASNQNLIGATVGEAYRRNLPGKLVFTEAVTVLPAFNNFNAYSATAVAGLTLPVYHRLSVSFNTSDNYLNDPAPFYKKNSYQFVTALTYAFH